MNKKLIWAIVLFVIGMLLFIAGMQYIGAAIIAMSIFLWSLYDDERKILKKGDPKQ